MITFALFGQSIVIAQLVFQIRKMSIQSVGCVGDIQVRIILKSKQVWQVPHQA
jgi:hypothetical protein